MTFNTLMLADVLTNLALIVVIVAVAVMAERS